MPDSSVLGLVVRLLLSLGVVIGLMLLLAAALRKRGLVVGGVSRGRGRGPAWDIDILARKGLGRTAQLAVVRAAGRTLVVGITEQRVTMLAEADPNTVAALTTLDEFDIEGGGVQRTGSRGPGTAGTGPTWKTMIDVVRDRTVRR